MKFPLSWIKDFIDINLPEQQIAKILTLAGLEVDGFAPSSLGFEKVVVGRVLKTEPHPEAERLCVATVSDGEEQHQVVCGAPNCREGLITAFAKIGAKITDETGKTFKIKKTKLRGVESRGMLCSGKELGISQEEEGIVEFSDSLKIGADVAEMYADTLFEVSLTPNLGHCASILGVARELSAVTGEPVSLPLIYIKEEGGPVEKEAAVNIIAKKKCPRYACRVVKDVTITPSPDWLQKRLLACDIRPINNVVDITNYVLLELGHPLHAFDYDQLEGHEIVVRRAEEGETFTTLDEKERTLSEDDLMICDGKKPVAIAGVMGGQNSEVTDQTKHVLLESAYFEPTGIRRTSKRLGLQTESSKRFERGCDPNNVIRALDRCAMLIQDICGGTVCKGVIDGKEYDFTEAVITCRLSRINKILGTQLSLSEVETAFKSLEMGVGWDGKDLFTVTVPTYRVDITTEIDLIEEAARIYGYENIPTKPALFTSSTLPNSPIFDFEREIRHRLLGEGLQEFLTCDLIGPSLLNIVKDTVLTEEAMVKVVNPTSIEQSVLRTSLLPGFLQLVKFNIDHQNQDISGFEIGRVHFKEEEGYKEQSVAGIVLSGKAQPHHWDAKPQEVDFFDLKGLLENLFEELGIKNVTYKNNGLSLFHPGRQASLYIDSMELGTIGEVHPAIMRRLDVTQRIYYAEIDLHNLLQLRQPEKIMEPLPIYPRSDRDLTLTLDNKISSQEIFAAIKEIPSKYLENVTLLDLYTSEKIGKGRKNATFRFIYRDKKKTIAQEAVEAEHARIKEALESRFVRR